MTIPKPGSIFYKLLIAYAITIAIIAGGYVAVRFAGESGDNLDIPEAYVERYLGVFVTEIGTPPDLAAAGRIAAESGLCMEITGPGLEWLSSTESAMGSTHSVTVARGAYRYAFKLPVRRERLAIAVLTALLAFVAVAIAVYYALVKRILRPLGEMDAVAREFGVNRLELRVHAAGRDEFAALGRAMNAMADRIEAYVKGSRDLLRAVSHEYRSPLTRMRLAVNMSGDSRYKESIEAEIRLLDALTGTLLERERLTEGPGSLLRETVPLHAWASAICDSYAGIGLPVRFRGEGPETTAFMDRARMEMALRNLVDNSLKYAEGSPVSVTVNGAMAGPFSHSIVVADSGPGMGEEQIARAGEPFLTAEPSKTGPREGGGFGLGLSIVSAVMAAHGGSMALRSAEPRGLSVTLSW